MFVSLQSKNLLFWQFQRLWNLILVKFLNFPELKFANNQNTTPLKRSKWQFLTFWNQQKLISRKIRVTGKLLNFHIVQSIEFYSKGFVELCGKNHFDGIFALKDFPPSIWTFGNWISISTLRVPIRTIANHFDENCKFM